MKLFKVFISYRNDQFGGYLAQLLQERLEHDGYHPFYAPESMGAGRFDDQLFRRLDECAVVIAVLSPHALDDRGVREDWMRKELAYAIRQGKTIIPIMGDGFEWPEVLPEELVGLDRYHGIKTSMGRIQPGQYEKLKDLLNESLEIVPHSAERTEAVIEPAGEVTGGDKESQKVEVRREHSDGGWQRALMWLEVALLRVVQFISIALMMYLDCIYILHSSYTPEEFAEEFPEFVDVENIALMLLVSCGLLWSLMLFCQKIKDKCKLRYISSQTGFVREVNSVYQRGITLDTLKLTAEQLQKHFLSQYTPPVMLEPHQIEESILMTAPKRGLSVWTEDMKLPASHVHVRFGSTDAMCLFGLDTYTRQDYADALLIQQGFVWVSKRGNIHCFRKEGYRLNVRFAYRDLQEAEVCQDGCMGILDSMNLAKHPLSWLRSRRVYNRTSVSDIARLQLAAMGMMAVMMLIGGG